ncbi:Pentatricopeptide repeat superfamily protein [Perilla frutescens var. frutescens]|nr:Pentatricopeptide repeat superfamily protein [Perilla frutescens var. frutescens]
MESIVKKYQQKFRKIKEEMSRWEELQSLLMAQFSNVSSIIQRLQVIQDSRNYGALRCVEGIEGAVLAKQMDSLQTGFISINNTMKEFCKIVSSLEKAVRDSKQLVKVGSAQLTAKQLKQRVGVKPTLADCLEGLRLLEEMHQSEYLLKLSVVSALPVLALKPSASASGDLGVLQQLLVDQPNIPREEGNRILGDSPLRFEQ